MRRLRILFVLLVVGSLLNWTVAAAPASAAPAPAGPASQVAAPAATGTINVTTYADEWDPPVPASANTKCSLREALELAYVTNDTRGCTLDSATATNIKINMPAGTYVLTVELALPDIGTGKTINIFGQGVVIDGGSQGPARHYGIFHVNNGALNLTQLTLQHGSRPGGGAIWMQGGSVYADHVTFKDNDAAADNTLSQSGGAILVGSGSLLVTNSLFQNNVAVDAGGAVSSSYGTFVKDTFVKNRASRGGAFADLAPTTNPVSISESEFMFNQARPTPFNAPGPGYLSYSDINGGGAIANYGNLSIDKTLLDGNQSELSKGGGGLDNHGQMVATECVFTLNTAVANGSGDNNGNISAAWGGAIINYGQLDLVRCSIHGNQADYAGAIFNHGNGILRVYNSTISNNTAKIFYGGLVNDQGIFGNNAGGAEIHLLQATIGKNNSCCSGPSGNVLYAAFAESVWFANTILDAGCNQVQYTVNGSAMSDLCATVPDPLLDPAASPALSMTAQLDLHPLTKGNSSVQYFMVQGLDAQSIAAGIGADGPLGCGDPHINHQDQNLAPRKLPCDAGALQVGSAPPEFYSIPSVGLVTFPTVDVHFGPGSSLKSMLLKNLGGGAMTYQVVDDGGSYAITLVSPPTGTLYNGQQTTLQFQCAPAEPGDHWRAITIETSAPNAKRASYKFRCTGVGLSGVASMSSEPGPYNMPQSPAGLLGPSGLSTSSPSSLPLTGTLSLSNPGPQPLTVSYGWTDNSAMWGLSSQIFGQAPASPAATLQTGQTLQLNLSCTPPAGVYRPFVNTLVFTTSDPLNPAIQYDVACQQPVDSPAEALNPASTELTFKNMGGVTVSPDGSQVLAGDTADNILQVYTRDSASGQLNFTGPASVPGMSGIYDIQYSHDGQFAYYTSFNGNGIVGLNRSGINLAVTDVITSGTPYLCGFNNHLPVFCPIGSMAGAYGLAVSPDDQYVYVAGLSDGTLTVFQRDLSSGQLSYAQTITSTIGGVAVLEGAARVATSPDGAFVYVVASFDNTVDVFERDSTGRLHFQGAYTNGSGGLTNLNTPEDMAISPDGQFVYVTAYGSNALNVFSRSSGDGGLSLSSVITGVTGAYGVAVSGDNAGRRLFLTKRSGNSTQVYGRDQATGALSFVNSYSSSEPMYVAVSPDNQDIYVTLRTGQGVQVFQTKENAPVLTNISPASALAGSSTFTLTAVGGRFYPNSLILWNGAPQTTAFVDEHTLQTVMSAVQIASPGNPTVQVRNSNVGGGGGDTLPLTFTVTAPGQPPVPSITSLDPPSASFGGGTNLVVIVHGANFAPDAVAYYNHQSVPTVFMSDHTLQITLDADILAQPGDGGLEVVNGGGAPTALALPTKIAASRSSTIVSFKVDPPGALSVPAVTSLSPGSLVSGTATSWLTILGHNFSTDPAAASVGRWNGSARPSVVLDANTLLMNVTTTDLAKVRNAVITVLTPGAGESRPLSFRVRAPNEKPIPSVTGAALNGWTLYVNGSDFDPAAQVLFNGVPRATTFVNQYQLQMTVTTTDRGGVITVSNPGPGGGLSNAVVIYANHLFLTIIRR